MSSLGIGRHLQPLVFNFAKVQMAINAKDYAKSIHCQVSYRRKSLRDESLNEFIEKTVTEREKKGFACKSGGKLIGRSEKP